MTRSVRLALMAAVFLVLVLVVFGAAATGSWQQQQAGESDFTFTASTPNLPTDTMSADELATQTFAPGQSPVDLGWLVAVFVAVVVALLVVLLALVLARLAPRSVRRTEARRLAALQPEPEVSAPEMQQGIAAAQQILQTHAEPRDAIVAAWVRLEQAAEQGGVGRTPAQTPTEFTAVVLQRTAADGEAVQQLRRLYSQARFSSAPITGDQSESARQSLEQIAQSWALVQS